MTINSATKISFGQKIKFSASLTMGERDLRHFSQIYGVSSVGICRAKS